MDDKKELFELDRNPTDRLIFCLLNEAENKDYITIESLLMLLKKRNVAFDIFHLLDQDNDDKLRMIIFDHLE